jgi:hypothetical protein
MLVTQTDGCGVMRTLKRLGARDPAIIYLLYFADLTRREIAKRMSIRS